MVTVQEIIAQQKRDITKMEYRQIIKMCKKLKPYKPTKRKRL